MKAIKVWSHNNEAVEEEIAAGNETQNEFTQYGANEFAVDFLKRSGIWKMLQANAKYGKDNGKEQEKKAGIAILSELLHLGHLSNVGKVINDSKLMVEMGYTFEEVDEARANEKGVIHKDTIRNYYKAIPQKESKKSFYGMIKNMRERKWFRGKTYAADGFELEVFGDTYEGIGKVWDDTEKRWKYGYKVELLMNVEKGRERIVGYEIGPINSDERELLAKILADIEKYVCRIKEMMDVLVLDRGYWGYDFLEGKIHGQYGIDYVTIAKTSFTFVKEDIRDMIDSGRMKFEGAQVYNASKKKMEEVKIGYENEMMHGYVSKKQPYQGLLNIVVVKKTIDGKEREIVYVTSKKITRNNAKDIVNLYAQRWAIENQGIRDLSQRWQIRIPIGRKRNAIEARIALVLKLYNAMKVMEMKHGEEWKKNKEQIRDWGERSFIGGQGIIVYAGEYFGAYSAQKYKLLIEEKLRRRIITGLKDRIPVDELEALFK